MFHFAPSYLESDRSLKKSKKDYPSYCQDVDDYVKTLGTFSQAWESPVLIYSIDQFRFIKSRIPDRANKRSKQSGYRIIIACCADLDNKGKISQPITGSIYLMTIYPKQGRKGQSKIEDKILKDLMIQCRTDITNCCCTPINKSICNH